MVMGGDSRSEGCGFESRHRILVVKLYCLFEKGENNQKEEAGFRKSDPARPIMMMNLDSVARAEITQPVG